MTERGKLTGSSGDRYDGGRGMNMGDGPGRNPEHEASKAPEKNQSTPVSQTETVRGDDSSRSESKQDKFPGIVSEITGAEKLVRDGVESDRPQDQMVAFMLVELNEFTKQQSLDSVDDRRLTMWYREWADYSEYLQDAGLGKTAEEKSRDADIARITQTVKKEILRVAEDEQSVKSGMLLREFEKQDHSPVKWKEIKNQDVKLKVLQLKEAIEKNRIKDLNEWHQAISQLRELELEWVGNISRDPEAKKAIERMRGTLTMLQRKVLTSMRQMEEPQASKGEKRKQEESEENVPDSNMTIEQHIARADEARVQAERFQAHSEKEDEYTNIERDRDAKEAQRRWKAEKKNMRRLIGKDGLTQELKENLNDWEKYGWTDEHKRQIANELEFADFDRDRDRIEAISRALLLDGKTGSEAVKYLEKVKTDHEEAGQRINLRSFLQSRFDDDKDVLMACGMDEDEANKYIRKSRAQRYLERPDNIEQLAWQISHNHQDTFGESGEYPTWERKVRMTAVFDTKETGEQVVYTVNENGYRINEHGKPIDAYGNVVDDESQAQKMPKNATIKLRIHEVANKNNIILWQRERTNYLQSQKPNEGIDFFNEIKLEKGAYHNVPLSQMFEGEESMFRGSEEEAVPKDLMTHELRKRLSSEGKDILPENYRDVSTQMQMEAYLLMMVRYFHIAYDQNKGDDEKLAEQLGGYFDRNHFTKELWGGRTLFDFMVTLPANYDEQNNNDGAVGGAVVDSYLTYYRISDFEMLEKSLGPNSKLFNLRKIIEVRDRLQNAKAEEHGSIGDPNLYYDLSFEPVRDQDGKIVYDSDGEPIVDRWRNEAVNKAFKPDGTVRSKKAFLDLVNIFNRHEKETMWTNVVEEIIKEESSKEKINSINQGYASLLSSRLVRWTGAAALNDTDFVGYDADTRMFHGYGYRAKLLKDGSTEVEGMDVHKNRGGDAGNPYTIPQFRAFAVNPMLGIVTERTKKPILQVFEELGAQRMKMKEDMEEKAKEHIDIFEDQLREKYWGQKGFRGVRGHERIQEMALDMAVSKVREDLGEEKIDKEYRNEYRDKARELHFTLNAEQSYYQNHWNRGRLLYKIIRSGEAINFEKYWGYSLEVGVTFDRKQFQDDVVKKLITPTRYAFSTFGNLNYSMMVRGYDVDRECWRTMPLGEMMFGPQLVDHKDFWKKDKNGKWKWKEMEVVDEEGQVVMGEDGKPKTMILEGVHETDWNKVQKNKNLLYKLWLLTYINGEFLAARQMRKWSSDPRKDFHFYEQALEVLEKIPGDFAADPTDMSKTKITSRFFDKDLMKWLREHSGTTKNKTYGLAALKAITVGKLSNEKESVLAGLGDGFRNFIGAIFSGF